MRFENVLKTQNRFNDFYDKITENVLRPKNHDDDFEHARAEDDRQGPIVVDRHLTRRNPAPISIILDRAAWKHQE